MKVSLGTMEMGRGPGAKESEVMIQEFMKLGHDELDTAIMYCGGDTEKILGQVLKEKKVKIACKVNPIGKNSLTASSIKSQFNLSLSRLGLKAVDILYLHMPDHETEINETLKGINEVFQEKKFQRFGLSNYSSWKVMEIYQICKAKGYVLPTVYQGMYNPITRAVEEELFPCLRRLNMSFYCYNPLAGGLLTGKYAYVGKDDPSIPKGRFRGVGGRWAAAYRERFWHKSNFEGIDKIKAALSKEEKETSLVEATMRWLVHHSKMSTLAGDAIIIGASKLNHMIENTTSINNAKPLPEPVVVAFDEAWTMSRANCPKYFR
eukprot:CAMPEP_0114538076 /NCGR_PEP_ID=MMETSP0109-20121206/29937_1 /TAXON_ID=29199 /ORGANISM="Chlorarachnion reptans, Strain CCCM449" /LENGTH=319 /DNA_ID=CAMNT_0001722045 /DNA_START=112 /DNA_END=1071 /DNA_ORIENTATION=-